MPTKSVFTRSYREMLQRLKTARRGADLSQVDVARALRWRQSAVSKMERGERRLDPIELQRLAKLYGTSVSSLLGEQAAGGERRKKKNSGRRSDGRRA